MASVHPSRTTWRDRRAAERFVVGNHVVLFRDGVEAFPAMLAAIEGATRQVLLEMYWFASDGTGRAFAAALQRAVRRGVEVALLYDAVGSWDTDSGVFAELRRAGVAVVEFNPVRPWARRFRAEHVTRRDHRKLLLVDGRSGFTGGANLADQWAAEAAGGEGWRDDVVRVDGPVVGEFVRLFCENWAAQGGMPLRAHLGVAPAAVAGTHRVRVLSDGRLHRRRAIVRAYLYNIVRAERRVWIRNSYFVPDRLVLRALRRAAAKGVDVRVIVPGISDVEIVRHASRSVWSRLMRSGVRIYEWTDNVLHAKSAVVDGRWCTIGTFNLDHWSLFYNLEVNVAVDDPGFAAVVETSFERDFARAARVDPGAFAFRPLTDRALEAVFYRFRKIL